MKRGIEDSDAWQSFAEYFARGVDAFDVGRIVKRCQINAIFDAAQDFICNQNGLLEVFAAMNDAMTDGVYVCDALDISDSRFFRTRPTQNKFDRRARVTKRRGRALR